MCSQKALNSVLNSKTNVFVKHNIIHEINFKMALVLSQEASIKLLVLSQKKVAKN
jgi:hypothetical protein